MVGVREIETDRQTEREMGWVGGGGNFIGSVARSFVHDSAKLVRSVLSARTEDSEDSVYIYIYRYRSISIFSPCLD